MQINEEVAAVKLRVSSILWNKPTYVGFCVLELAKLHMYNFHYNAIKRKYGPRAKLLFTDTDSLCYVIETKDVYDDMKDVINFYDTSDYPEGHKLHSTENAKVIGKFKDECNGVPPMEFVGLCAKMYSLLTEPDVHKFTVKGVKKSCAKKLFNHASYVRCLENSETLNANFNRIGSVAHELRTIPVSKVALTPYDDKRYLLSNYETLAYGHISI